LDSKKLAFKLAELALTKKAEDIKILDLRKLTTITDFFVICTSHSDPQVKAIADAVMDGSKKIGERVWHKEGMTQKSWVLLDFVDVVVHIFLRDTRNFYGLEKLWGDADITEVSDEPVKPETKKSTAKKPTAKKGSK
jgi:ribosome-associated protein